MRYFKFSIVLFTALSFLIVRAQVIKGSASVNVEATTTPVYTTSTQAVVVKPKTLEEKIDNPTLWEISRCESGHRQFDLLGNILRGKVNKADVGLFQINEKYHLANSIRLGFDIYTEDGNIAYAKYLYRTQGTQPWKASESCWKYKTNNPSTIGSGGGESVRLLPIDIKSTTTLDITK